MVQYRVRKECKIENSFKWKTWLMLGFKAAMLKLTLRISFSSRTLVMRAGEVEFQERNFSIIVRARILCGL